MAIPAASCLVTTDGQAGVVGDCLEGWTAGPPDLVLVSSEGATVPTHRMLLCLHSRLAASLLTADSTAISLPASTTALTCLINILQRGFLDMRDFVESDLVQSTEDVSETEIDAAASLLGLEIVLQENSKRVLGKTEAIIEIACDRTDSYLGTDLWEENIETGFQTEENKETVLNETEDDDIYNFLANIACHFCDQKFLMIKELKKHLKKHGVAEPKRAKSPISNQEPSICQVCQREFASRRALESHSITHEKKIESFDCSECGKVLLKKKGLKKHMKNIHKKIIMRNETTVTEEKSQFYECNQCGKRKSKPNKLSEHIRTVHTNPSLLVCKLCDKRLSSTNKLSEHIRTVHKNPSLLVCKFCDKRLSSSNYLNYHIKMVHKI